MKGVNKLNREGLEIKIYGDDSEFRQSLNSIESVAKKGLGITFKGVAAISGGFAVATGAALKYAGDLEQNLGGSKAVFDKYAEDIQNKAEKAFKNMGLSTSNYLATANKMGALFKGAGFEMEEAADLSSKAMQRASDVASIMGIDVTMAMESIAGAAKGNFTMMDNLGVAMNDTTLNAYALEKGISKTTQQMTNQEKIALAMEMFLDRTAYATGNYAKENETLAGALTTAKAALQNFMSGEGSVEDLSESLTNAIKVISENVEALAPELAEGFMEIIQNLIPVVPQIIRQLLPSIIDTIIELFAEAVAIIPDLIVEIANGIGEAIPAIEPLMKLIELLADNIDVLTVVVSQSVAAFVTYKSTLFTMNTLQQISSWFSKTKTAVSAYTVALQANSGMAIRGGTVNGLLLSTLTPLQIVYGVLTGKIKLADAAQHMLNLTVLKNPYVWAAAAIAALVAGIVAYSTTHKSVSKEITESLDEIKKLHEETMKSIDDTSRSSLAEAEVAKTLKNELFELESQIKSNKLSNEESEAVQNKFNVAANELEEMIPGITSKLYDETGAINVQHDAVNDLIDSYYDLAVAKATATAYEEKLNTAAKSLIDAKEKQKEAVANAQSMDDKYRTSTSIIGAFRMASANKTLEKTNEEVKKYEKELESYRDGWTEAQKELTKLTKETTEDNVETIIDGNNKIIDNTKKTSNDQLNIKKQQFEKEYKNLQRAHKRGIVEDEDYYDQLMLLRNEYLDVGSEEWEDYTDEIFSYHKDKISKVEEMLRDSVEELEDLQKDLSNGFKDELELFTVKTSVYTDADGNEIFRDKKAELVDIDKQTQELNEYSDTLNKLKDKTDIPDELFSHIRSMGMEDGKLFTEAILELDDEELQEYIDSWKKYQDATAENAKALTSREAEAVKKGLTDVFGKVPEEFFKYGGDSAEKFGEGFLEQFTLVLEQAKAIISATLSGLLPKEITISNPGNTVTNQDNSTTNYYIQASQGESTHQALNALREYSVLNNLRN